MQSLWPICVANEVEGIITVIVFAVIIIGNIVKAISKATGTGASPQQRKARPSSTYKAPQDELNEFLKSIGAQQPKPLVSSAPPPTPPISRARTAAQIARKTLEYYTGRTPAAPPPPPPPMPRPARKVIPEKKHAVAEDCDSYGFHFQDKTVKLHELRQSLGSDLVKKSGLKKAILMQEIMGKPLGMKG